ncbi:MAG: DUF4115 domain-containing protein [Bacillota bacterium]|nr:MAG: hypothetical protein DIU70_01255 [Bacillota bacterium]
MAGELETIGKKLRQAREAQGLTLAMAEDATKIRKKYLLALEEGRESDLPGEVYTKGFLRSYGNFLGLDGDALVQEYKALKAQAREGEAGGARQGAGTLEAGRVSAGAGRAGRPSPGAEGPWAGTGTPTPTAGFPGVSRRRAGAPAGPTAGGWVRWALAVLVAGLGLIVGWYVLVSGRGEESAAPPAGEGPGLHESSASLVETPPEEEPPATEEPPEPAVQVVRGEPYREAGSWWVPITVSPGPIEVTLAVKEGYRAWYRVEADGQRVAEATWPGGTVKTYVATERMRLHLGDLAAITVTVNGVEFGHFPEPYRRIVIEAR